MVLIRQQKNIFVRLGHQSVPANHIYQCVETACLIDVDEGFAHFVNVRSEVRAQLLADNEIEDRENQYVRQRYDGGKYCGEAKRSPAGEFSAVHRFCTPRP